MGLMDRASLDKIQDRCQFIGHGALFFKPVLRRQILAVDSTCSIGGGTCMAGAARFLGSI